LIACIVGRMREPGAADGLGAGMASRISFISLIVVLNCCQVPQNCVAEASLAADVPPEAGLALGAGLPLGVVLPLRAELPLEDEVPQADSARAIAAITIGVASNPSRPVVRDVRSMPL
jgi:hypothetical protein